MSGSAPLDPIGGGGGSDDPDDGGSSGGDDGDSGGSGGSGGSSGGSGGNDGPLGFDSIAPDFLADNLALLQAFLSNPRNFVIGAVVTTILETIFGFVTLVVDTILLVLAGSEPSTFNAEGETLGLVDIPVAIADLITGVITPTILPNQTPADQILSGIESFNEPIFAAASFAGPLSPIVITAIVAGEVILALLLAQRAVYVLADFAQLGGLTE
jgi:hypothetical protein